MGVNLREDCDFGIVLEIQVCLQTVTRYVVSTPYRGRDSGKNTTLVIP